MSDDASSSTAQWTQGATAAMPNDGTATRSRDIELTAAERVAELQEQRKKIKSKRLDLLDDLIRTMDILIYAEIAVIYYMDSFFMEFFFRVLGQLWFLTPKPATMFTAPEQRPYVITIVLTNVGYLVAHMIDARPAAGEDTRFYLHGGLMIDFIGQKGPTSKLHLAILDLVILILQLTMLSVHMKRLRLKKKDSTNENSADVGAGRNASGVNEAQATTVAQLPGQDLDHEERGLHRRPSISLAISENRVTADLLPTTVGAGAVAEVENAEVNPLDVFRSGQAIVADLHVLDTMVEQFEVYRHGWASRSGLSTGMEANVVGRRFAVRVGRRSGEG